ncbi:MAG: hypothetical protein V1890_07210 [Candidatus Zixiibacteriota bacterium]
MRCLKGCNRVVGQGCPTYEELTLLGQRTRQARKEKSINYMFITTLVANDPILWIQNRTKVGLKATNS